MLNHHSVFIALECSTLCTDAECENRDVNCEVYTKNADQAKSAVALARHKSVPILPPPSRIPLSSPMPSRSQGY
ncbi:hypothetical protein L6452_40551 [Arctium lappa]|uniref:Uncharacterized protein n=1 Tax=Arctium lappa TaxID=4217 RepID=A0ACB8XRC6_ARCLA|nr:hypothetical protein L6452_40551 [Arctium lappa]